MKLRIDVDVDEHAWAKAQLEFWGYKNITIPDDLFTEIENRLYDAFSPVDHCISISFPTETEAQR